MQITYSEAKRRRFQKAARLLTGEIGINLQVISDAMAFPAAYNLDSKAMTLNDAVPYQKPHSLEALAFDRAKLYHECGHVCWTRDAHSTRERFCNQSHNQQAYLDVSNILEDGRIEWLMTHRWHGAAAYLRLLFGHFLNQPSAGGTDADKLNGLAFYVRALTWRNAAEEAFWKPALALIGKAIRAKSTHEVCRLAFEVVEMVWPASPASPKGKGKGGKGKGNPQPQEESGEAQSQPQESGEESGEDASQDASEDASGEEEEDSESEEQESEPASGSGSGSGSGEEKPRLDVKEEEEEEAAAVGAINKAVEEAVKEAIKEALAEVKEEVREEQEFIRDAMEIPTAQQYEGSEEAEASFVSQILQSIQTERMRKTYLPSRKTGRINSRRISGIVSGDTFLQTRQDAKGPVNVALCLDCSGSMAGDQLSKPNVIAASCGRVINGALEKAKIKSLIITFGEGYNTDDCRTYTEVKLGPLPADGGTPTHKAIEAATVWLKEQEAEAQNSGGIILVVTDGQPDNHLLCVEAFTEAKAAGFAVVVVGIGQRPQIYPRFGPWWHEVDCVASASDLPRMLEDKLINAVAMV